MPRKKSAPAKLYTVADIALAKPCAKYTVTRTAKALGIGSLMADVWVFTEAEREKLLGAIKSRAGHPGMSEGKQKP